MVGDPPGESVKETSSKTMDLIQSRGIERAQRGSIERGIWNFEKKKIKIKIK
jgi:hypothetical protein